ncbi:hypothetical protein [Crocosphaera sp.]|uniref:hypothetical protein n=1 Tax=Crocosphaera sp. TaxID=2729996 RepID=UPI0026388836|nr:hypothetical protein [Crocosphaera sp.]MDJ0582020.1 hypothetical protein [Crocosphaera sp.]
MKNNQIIQKLCFLAVLIGSYTYPSQALIAEKPNSNISNPILIAQNQVPTSWKDSRYNLKKTTFYNDRVEWIVEDTCRELTCLSPFVHAQFQDADGITIETGQVFFEGTNPYRAKANIPSSIYWSQIKRVVVANGPS